MWNESDKELVIMDGTTFGKLIVDIVLAYFIGKSTWNKTQSSGKTTVVVIIALISPLIAWIVSVCFSPAEQRRDQTPVVPSSKVEVNLGEMPETNDLSTGEVSSEHLEENANDEERLLDSSVADDTDNLVEDPIEDMKDEPYEETYPGTIESEHEPVKVMLDSLEDKQDLMGERLTIMENVKPIVFCRFCGTKLNDGAQFCHKCGKKVG